jgi:hypothetical protein
MRAAQPEDRMKYTHLSWRAQKGTKIYYAVDRLSGRGEVLRVLPGSTNRYDRIFLVRDLDTGKELEVASHQMRPA